MPGGRPRRAEAERRLTDTALALRVNGEKNLDSPNWIRGSIPSSSEEMNRTSSFAVKSTTSGGELAKKGGVSLRSRARLQNGRKKKKRTKKNESAVWGVVRASDATEKNDRTMRAKHYSFLQGKNRRGNNQNKGAIQYWRDWC